MKKTKKVGLLGLITLLISCLSTTTIFGYWTVSSETSQTISNVDSGGVINKNEYSSDVACAYINDNPTVFYTSIEKALYTANSGDTVYVIPGTNPTIRYNCEIKSGVTLCLPYEDDLATTHTYLPSTGRQNNYIGDFADVNATNVANNRKSLVTIAKDVAVTNNGTIIVGGVVGVNGQVPSGHTGTAYAEILMSDNSSIVNNKVITLYGYIKETSTNNGSNIIHSGSSSKISTPLVIYDFRGGSYSLACKNKNIMPFTSYDFPNCQVYQKFVYGSILTGMVTIYASAWAESDVNILAPNSETALFKQTNGYIGIKYTPANCLYTTNDVKTSTTEETANITHIYVNGNVSLSSMQLNIGTSINTADFDCPICYKFRINIETGSLNIQNRMKFMGGSEVIIGQNSSVQINASTIFYQNYIPPIKYSSGVIYPSVFHTAKLINNGTLTLNSNFGGLIETSVTGATLSTTSSYSESYSSTEALNISGSSFLASVSESETHTEYAKAYFGATVKPNEARTIPSSKSYNSLNDFWYVELTEITDVQISPSSGASEKGASATYQLTASVVPVENLSKNIKYTWKCNQGDNYLSSTEGEQVTLTTDGNSSNSNKNYVVTCTVNFTKSDGTSGTVSNTATFIATKSCVTGDTLISLSDGSFKQIKDITYDDNLLAFDHITGKIVETKAAIIFVHEESECTKLKLLFSDNSYVNVLDDHEFFDLTLNRYVDINEDTYLNYIGHSFAKIANNVGEFDYESVILERVEKSITYEKSYSIQSAVNINFITNSILSRTSPAYEGWFDYFDFKEPLTYDPIKMKEDIDTYGLYDYSEFIHLGVTKEQFIAFNGPYLKVLVGKGIVTYEDIIALITVFLK